MKYHALLLFLKKLKNLKLRLLKNIGGSLRVKCKSEGLFPSIAVNPLSVKHN